MDPQAGILLSIFIRDEDFFEGGKVWTYIYINKI